MVLAAGVGVPGIAQAEPLISRTCNHSLDCTGWFTGPVALDWTVSAGDVVRGCVDVTIGEDTPGRQEGCIAKDATDVVQRTVTITLDQTAPVVTGVVPGRQPDHAGWYTHPVTFGVQGSDLTSGIASCEAPGYAGPDARDASVVASCRDRAGNAAARAFPLSYDATPPDPGRRPRRRATTSSGSRGPPPRPRASSAAPASTPRRASSSIAAPGPGTPTGGSATAIATAMSSR